MQQIYASPFRSFSEGVKSGEQRRGSNLLREYGGAAMQGDQNALNVLASNPYTMDVAQGHMDRQQRQQNLDRDFGMQQQRLAISQEQLAMTRERARMETEQLAAAGRLAEAELEAEQVKTFFGNLGAAKAAGNQQAYQAIAANGPEEFRGIGWDDYEGAAAVAGAGLEGYFEALQGPKTTEADMEIWRMMSAGIPRDTAIKIKEGVYDVSRHPTDGSVIVIDLSTGQTVFDLGAQQAQEAQPQQQGDTPLKFEIPGANDAFGVEGVVKYGANMVTDTFGFSQPFPEVQEAQNDFGNLQEEILSDVASGYNRQPPSWLLQALRDLTPKAGNLTEGPQAAQSKLRALDRRFEREIAVIEQKMKRRMDQKTRGELEQQKISLQAGRDRVQGTLGAFDQGVQIRPEVADRLKAYQ